MTDRVVIKFGGADLSTGEKIRRAAELVVKSPYDEKVVVVSAMGEATNNLVNTIKSLGSVDERDNAEILSMGERTSARIFCSALKAIGAEAVVFDPADDNWPIITDSNFLGAKPDLLKSRVLTQRFLEPFLQNSIPVVCGFLGKSIDGDVTTLGRGGSDTTAMLLANFLEANEVILVKETSGVLSADPRLVTDAKPLSTLDVHDMFDLAQGGAKIVRPDSLSQKLPDQKLRIVNFAGEKISEGGTEITGSFNIDSVEMNSNKNLIALNIVCQVSSQNLERIFSSLSGKPIYGVSSGSRSLTVFTSNGDLGEILNKLHSIDSLKAISHRENVALLQVSHPLFVDSPGEVAKISAALSQYGMNIIEVTTSKATINVFIEEDQLNKATEAISHVYET